MKRTLYWLLVTASFAAALWYGFWQDIAGARYLVQFYVFAVCLPASFLMNSDTLTAALAKEKPAPIRHAISLAINWAALTTLIWHGYIFTSVAWATALMLLAIARNSAKKLSEAKGAEA